MIQFNETGLAPALLRAIDELGFKNPTPIQEKTIPTLLESKKDLVALAQTGTGKTAAFGLPVLQLIDTENKLIQSLALCPTRELCLQIAKDLQSFSKYIKGFKVLPVYGGANIVGQIKDLKAGAHVVVGTPGRVVDLIKRKALKLGQVKWMILDEADEMLNMGFKDDLDFILSNTSDERQTLLFSATMPKEIERIAKTYMHNPELISIGNRNEGAENVTHEFYVVNARDRYEALKRIADINPNIYGIVFCRTRQETKDVADKLMQDGYNADALHGDLSQAQRDHVMGRFRTRHLQMLVATDVAARGLDVNDLTHVINYNLPDDLEVYVHRSGRTGRAGKKGISISIIHSREPGKIRDLEKITRKKFERKDVPGGSEICGKQLFNLIDKVENIEVDSKKIDEYLPIIYKKLEWLSREDLIKHFVSVEFNRFLNYYKNAPDLNVKSKGNNENDRDGRKGSRRSNSSNFTRFHINMGTKHQLKAGDLINLINECNPKDKIEIGKIDLLRNFSFFEADSRFEKQIVHSFKNAFVEDLELTVTVAKPEKPQNNFGDRGSYSNSKKRNRKKR
ncbi:MAG: DEAD/DEAH box helicase [Bacteroidales bacterium]|nr:DEAD/DEAH box helicase [Bacteroidales bacterium]MBN2819552.1 DEAD/DEAH box helicase [Bacteroidales bacterium]